ncbi:MAG: helix-turn-helix domain-containing protein [Opitutaceae bacterium]
MASDPTAKRQALKASGTFNARFSEVRDELFQPSAFFDPQDALQVKYEAVRAIEVEGRPMARAAKDFGLSRPTLYQTQRQLKAQGLEGLSPHTRGPKGAHKLTAAVRTQLQAWIEAETSLSARDLAKRLRQFFHLKVHPRTIEKTLKIGEKKGRWKSP